MNLKKLIEFLESQKCYWCQYHARRLVNERDNIYNTKIHLKNDHNIITEQQIDMWLIKMEVLKDELENRNPLSITKS